MGARVSGKRSTVKPAKRTPPTPVASFAGLIEEHVGFALVGCPDDCEPIEFLDAPDFEAWTDGQDSTTIESVSFSLGWLRGAAGNADVTIRSMLEEFETLVPTRTQLRRQRRA